MTREQALAAFKAGERVEYKGPASDWTLMRGSDAVAWGALADNLVQFRPAPAPVSRARLEELAEETRSRANWLPNGQGKQILVEFGHRLLRQYGTRLLYLIEGPGVELLRTALAQAEREYLGEGEGK